MPLSDRLLQAILSRSLTHPRVDALLKTRHDWWRRVRNKPHQVVVWLSLTDPYSYLLIQTLPKFVAQFNIQLIFKILPYQEPDQYFSYYLRDAWHLANFHQLQFHHFHAPSQEQCLVASQLLLGNRHLPTEDFLTLAKQTFLCLWEHQHQKLTMLGLRFNLLSLPTTRQKLQQAQALFEYYHQHKAAMLFYQGQWFHGIEELDFLAQQLSQQQLNINNTPFVLHELEHHHEQKYLINDSQQLAMIRAQKHELDYYFCFHHPVAYIYLVAVAQLADYYQINLRLKPVLMYQPQVLYSSLQWSQQLAHLQYLADAYDIQLTRHPVLSEQGLHHCLALFNTAQTPEQSLTITLCLLRAIWGEGKDASHLAHLKSALQSIDYETNTLKAELKNSLWQSTIEQNTSTWLALDLPELPSFYLQGERRISFCGRQRLWAIEMALIDNIKDLPKT